MYYKKWAFDAITRLNLTLCEKLRSKMLMMSKKNGISRSTQKKNTNKWENHFQESYKNDWWHATSVVLIEWFDPKAKIKTENKTRWPFAFNKSRLEWHFFDTRRELNRETNQKVNRAFSRIFVLFEFAHTNTLNSWIVCGFFFCCSVLIGSLFLSITFFFLHSSNSQYNGCNDFKAYTKLAKRIKSSISNLVNWYLETGKKITFIY